MMTESTARLARASWGPFVEVPVRLGATVVREPRDHCANCRHRRVLYHIAITSGVNEDRTEARCRRCWGMLR